MFVAMSASGKKSAGPRRRGSKQRQFTIVETIFIFIARVRLQPFFVPQTYAVDINRGVDESKEKSRKSYSLGLLQRLFLTLDDPISRLHCLSQLRNSDQSVQFSRYTLSDLHVLCNIIELYCRVRDSTLRYSPSSCPEPVCHNDPVLCPDSDICQPQPPHALETLEIFCLAVFTADYVPRILISPLMPSRLSRILPRKWDTIANVAGQLPDPEYPWYEKIVRYATKFLNVIDILAIIPAFIALSIDHGPSVSIVRILRLARIFRVFKIGGMNSGVPLFTRTVKRALPAVSIMFFFSFVAVLVFGSVMFYLEAGTYEVTNSFPDGSFVRWNYLRSEKEESPFKSILHACYWAVVTTTTVGYGDIVPTSPFGRAFAVFFMYLGIILLALPISVVGASFQREYEILYPQSEDDDDDDECTELSDVGNPVQTPLARADREEIKQSLTELNHKVTVLMDMMTQQQRNGPGFGQTVRVNGDAY